MSTSPVKSIAATVAGAALVATLLNLGPSPQAPGQPAPVSVTLACSPENATCSLRVYLGHSPRGYNQFHDTSFTNVIVSGVLQSEFTVTNLNSTLPWFIAVALIQPVNGVKLLSRPSNEVLLIPTNCQPFIYLTNGLASVSGWSAAGVTNEIESGQLNQFAPIAEIDGTNGPWLYQEPLQPGNKFFRITTVQ
jgi:hypothetical protein